MPFLNVSARRVRSPAETTTSTYLREDARVLQPDLYVQSIFVLDLAELSARGIDTLLVDLDNTLLARNSETVTDDAKAWASRAKAAGFKVCIVSNNWHERVHKVAREIGLDIVAKGTKPLPFAFLRALRALGSKRHTAAAIGDQMFTDVLGGRLLGMTSVMVVPLSSSDLPHTVVLRRIERAVLAGRQPLH